MSTLYWCGLSKSINSSTGWGTSPAGIVFRGSRSGTVLTVTTVYGGSIVPGIVGTGPVLYTSTGIASGTIIAQLTGTTGGAGTYTTSASGTIASADMYTFPANAVASTPTITDDVIFGAPSVYSGGSGPTATINAVFSFRSLTTTAGSNGSVYTIAGTSATTIDGNLSLSSGTLWTHSSTLNLNGNITSSTINTNGTAISSNVVMNSSSGTLTLTSDFGQNNSTTNVGSFTFTTGTINLAGYAWNCGTFVTGTGTLTRTLSFGSTGVVNVTSIATASVINVSSAVTPSYLVLTGTNPTFVLTGTTGVGTRTISWTGSSWAGSTLSMPSLKVTGGSDTVVLSVGGTTTGNLNLLDLTGFSGTFQYNTPASYTVSAYNSITIPSTATAIPSSTQVINLAFTPTSGIYSFELGAITYPNGIISFPTTGTAIYNKASGSSSVGYFYGGSSSGSINIFGTLTVNLGFGTSSNPIVGVNLGSATINVGSAYITTPFNAGTSTVNVGSGPSTLFYASGLDLYNLTITTLGSILTVNAKSFNSFSFAATQSAQLILFQSDCSFNTFSVNGVSGNLLTIGSDTTTQRTLTKNNAWTLDNSVDNGNNAGLTFLSSGSGNNSYLQVSYINGVVLSTATGNMFLMF
jgi:hypothetical protein